MAHTKEQAKAYREAHKAKLKSYFKARYDANKEAIKVQSKSYRESNKERLNTERRVRYSTNKGRRLMQNKTWRDHNKATIKERNKIYREVNRVEVLKQKRDWNAKNKERVAATKRKRNYGISLEVFNTLSDGQSFACALCHQVKEDKTGKAKTLHVDHCHDTGNVRELLCGECNRGLGYFYDNPALLERAAEYLRFHAREGKLTASIASCSSLEE